MKTIEERVDAWLYRTIPVTPEGFKQRLEGALTELATDLNAEKEKELAELREKHHEYVNLSLAKQLALQVECDKQRPALECCAGEINTAFNRIKEPEPIGGTGWTLHQYDNRVKAAKMYFEEGVKLGMQLAKRKL